MSCYAFVGSDPSLRSDGNCALRGFASAPGWVSLGVFDPPDRVQHRERDDADT
jgi:hypothetical protein